MPSSSIRSILPYYQHTLTLANSLLFRVWLWYIGKMRYLLLIVAVSSLCFSADADPATEIARVQAAKIQVDYSEKCDAIRKQYVIELVEIRKKTYAKLAEKHVSDDPKQSEIELSRYINAWNTRIDDFDRSASNIKTASVQGLDIALREMYFAKYALIDKGIMPAAAPRIEVASVDAPKPKEKKKITAVLADGTKVE